MLLNVSLMLSLKGKGEHRPDPSPHPGGAFTWGALTLGATLNSLKTNLSIKRKYQTAHIKKLSINPYFKYISNKRVGEYGFCASLDTLRENAT